MRTIFSVSCEVYFEFEPSPIDINLATLSYLKKIEKQLLTMLQKKEKTNFVYIGPLILFPALKQYFKEQSIPHLKVLKNEPVKCIKTATSIKKLTTHEEGRTSQIQELLPRALGASLADYSKETTRDTTNLLPPLVRSIAAWKKTSPWFYVTTIILLIFSVGWLMAFGFSWGSTTAQLRVASENLILIERQYEKQKTNNTRRTNKRSK